MNIEVTFDPSELENAVQPSPEFCQIIQGALGERFFEITRENIGETGIDRPSEWAPLSPRYARKVGRDYATLHLKGDLEAAIKFDNSSPDQSTVSISDSDVPYATRMQWGDKNMPARPYFPITPDGQLTEFTESSLVDAAQRELDNL